MMKDIERSYDKLRWYCHVVKEKNLRSSLKLKQSFAMDLSSWHCSCQAWRIYRLACKHACTCREATSLSVYQFCDGYLDTYVPTSLRRNH
ncbi:hypothetical protein F511_27324 [Dorcoceras hygrometricum]|uniref:SWIM-type domain-containing protein n=1 Tax=Dorcoceras hygrometricum TaxID=472368 RepID=A0A2Z7BJN2_9LAMI|nr:hypothetical protein F511_27324 [Dorcoceras hygrometricum]